MTATMPTRITIEVHSPEPANDAGATARGAWSAGVETRQASPVVRVLPADGVSSSSIVTIPPREEVAPPAAYEPGPCTCLDDEDCGADHAND